MPRYENTFYEAGGPSFAPLSTYEWWILWQALQNTGDNAKVAAAMNELGALVQADWLDSLPPVPDEVRPPDVLKAMFAAHDQHEDDWIAQQCGFAVSSLERLRSAERPYTYRELESTAQSLVSLAGSLFTVARDREEEIERDDRKE